MKRPTDDELADAAFAFVLAIALFVMLIVAGN